MTTADWALIISLCSAFVSLASFIWNVWSKFLHPKARVKARMTVCQRVWNGQISPSFIQFGVSNHGPGPITISNVLGCGRKTWFGKKAHFILTTTSSIDHALHPTPNYPIGVGQKIDVGDQWASYASVKNKDLVDFVNLRIGYHDSFGRTQWVSRKDVREVMKSIREALDGTEE